MYHAPYYRLHLLQPIKDLKAKTSADLPAGPVVTEIEATYPPPPFPPPPLPLSPLLPPHPRSSSPPTRTLSLTHLGVVLTHLHL